MLIAVRVHSLIFFLLLGASCYSPPRMVKEFNYHIHKQEVLLQCRDALKDLEYELEVFAPESHILITKTTRIKGTLRQYDYSIVIFVTDRIEMFLVVDKHIFKRGSESSFGGQNLFMKQVVDALPRTLQNKVFLPIMDLFDKTGFTAMNSFEKSIK